MKKLGDWAIALTVVACSAALFLALAFALQGNPFNRPSRTLRVQFPDITGIQASSLVKYAGATAGTVHSVRMLTPAERVATGNPANAVEITLSINNNVPPLSTGLIASVASDTLLSDKFVLLDGGDPKAPDLANGTLIASVAPVTFDALLRDLSGALARIRQLLGGGASPLEGILPKIDRLLADLDETAAQARTLIGNGNGLIDHANGLVKNGDGLVANADGLVNSGRTLIDSNKDAIQRTIRQLAATADSLDAMARRVNNLVRDNEPNIGSITKEAKEAMIELRAAAISARALGDQLRARPQSVLWGPGRPPRTGN
ncbi:MAG: MlaD family protein [Terrimicrobiaceae bacterium]|nr:MlaD family protein [Terrimicrobiaceae bacterium]